MEDINYNNIYNSDNYKDFLNLFKNLNLNDNKDKSDNSCNLISGKIFTKKFTENSLFNKRPKKRKKC